ncbi:hypothetical protein LRAMOSA04856 [Lichtheimia ramosa]|uniref:Thioesterase domain-containing protein n=1 Tax=Lichtheimia ramosa TaxID=688394 RepID=A0A077WZE3_9FUNG|nr:hypothetical protein LRAMOSA04856 [Lichtheimia ramosa]
MFNTFSRPIVRRGFTSVCRNKPKQSMGQVQCYSTKPSPPTSKRRVLTTLGCCALTGGAVYATMAIQHADALVDQRMSLLGTTENDVAIAIAERENLPVVRAARENPDMYEFEAYAYLRGSAKVQSLTAATLRGKGRIIVPPVLFYNKDRTEAMAVVHLGSDLCGHIGIVHGGMIATLLDEILACVALPALPRFVGYTANLNVDYRKPLKAGQWVVLKSRLNRVEGRKAYVEAWVESADGQTKFTEAKSLYVGPKMPF